MQYKINNHEGYLALKKRFDKGTELLKGRFFEEDSKIQTMVKHWKAMGAEILWYEIINDIIQIPT